MLKATSYLLIAVALPTTDFARAECGVGLALGSIPEVVIDPNDRLVSRTVQFEVGVSAEKFFADFHSYPLSRILPGTTQIAGVQDIRILTGDAFGAVGSRRVVCQTDANTALEEVIEIVDGRSFKYKVWGYSTPAARPIEFGLGEFIAESLGADRARITWSYSFKLRSNRFPGYLGKPGRYLFMKTFMNKDYAEFMDSAVRAMQDIFKTDL